MVISPDRKDFSTILNVLGKLILGLGAFMLIPMIVALFYKELSPFFDFLISFLTATTIGLSLLLVFPRRREVGLTHSFFIVSCGWLVASLLGALPLYLSAHWKSFLDAWFEAMSGFATTGLILVTDLDHLSFSHNMWRHLMMFVGGQGIILAALSILAKGRGSAFGFYLSEGRQEKILPNVIDTARFIWKVSFVYLSLGVIAFTGVLYLKGLSFDKSFFHSIWLFMAAFDTGGFAPQAQNIAYYHSSLLEMLTVGFMILGAINFNLHFWLWFKNKGEIAKNFEIKTFLCTFTVLLLLMYTSLSGLGGLFRKGFYQLISAHSGCGFTNLAGFELKDFGGFALFVIIIAMALGGGMCSTTGGIKLMRLGFMAKAFLAEVRRWMMPDKAVYKTTYHHLKDQVLEEPRVKEAFIIFSLYLFTYIAGGLIAMALGYEPIPALFESVSATANVGLSAGITTPSMPTTLKVTYIFQMWLGRLEFLAIFVSLGAAMSLFKK